MKKYFKWVVKNGSVLLLRRSSFGIFGEQWDSFAKFDANDDNIARGKQIIKLLNECVKPSDNLNDND